MGSIMSFVYSLTLLFIAFRLSGIIDWNWVQVLSPILITITFNLLVLTLSEWAKERRNEREREKL